MKRRMDFVTNSSSSSYIIALYKDKPEIGETRCFINMPINKCKVSEIPELWGYYSDTVQENLYREIFDKGMTEDIRIKFYQFLFWKHFSGLYWCTSYNKSDAERIEEVFNEIMYCLKSGFSLASEEKDVDVVYPMVPDYHYFWNPEYAFVEFVDIYYRDEMIAYIESEEKSFKTLVKWFENLTGCTWVLTCGWEDDEPPKGSVMRVKADGGDLFWIGI